MPRFENRNLVVVEENLPQSQSSSRSRFRGIRAIIVGILIIDIDLVFALRVVCFILVVIFIVYIIHIIVDIVILSIV